MGESKKEQITELVAQLESVDVSSTARFAAVSPQRDAKISLARNEQPIAGCARPVPTRTTVMRYPTPGMPPRVAPVQTAFVQPAQGTSHAQIPRVRCAGAYASPTF